MHTSQISQQDQQFAGILSMYEQISHRQGAAKGLEFLVNRKKGFVTAEKYEMAAMLRDLIIDHKVKELLTSS